MSGFLAYDRITASKPFRILVGPNKKEFVMHAELLAHLSNPLATLVGGTMKEARTDVAEWPEVDEETFVRFCEFAYTGDYGSLEPGLEPEPEQSGDQKPGKGQGKANPKTGSTRTVAPDTETGWSPSSPFRSTSKKTVLWEQFKKLRYDAPEQSQPARKRTPIPADFLSHAHLYVLGDYYDIEALMLLSLRKLHEELVGFDLAADRDIDVAKLVDYCYKNTVDKSGQDRLRVLVTNYVACKAEILWPNPYFQSVLEDSGEVSKGVIEQLMKRLD